MRPPIDLNLLRAFAAVYEAGSFVGAGEKLGTPRSTLSRSIAALEESLGVMLFQRTTRRVAPTSAATALYERVASQLVALDASFDDLPDAQAAPSGTLRVTTTPEFGAMVLSEAIVRYIQRYPRVHVELILTMGFVDPPSAPALLGAAPITRSS